MINKIMNMNLINILGTSSIEKEVLKNVSENQQKFICINNEFVDLIKNISYTMLFTFTFICCLLLIIIFIKGWQNNGN